MRNRRDLFIRTAAERVLKQAGITAPEVPIEQLVRAHGLAVVEGQIPKGWGYFDPSGWAVQLSADLYREQAFNRNRRRFTLAHELGHCVLEHGQNSCWNLGLVAEVTDLRELADAPDFEAEAHLFAREVLLPRPWLERDWEQAPEADRWARIYGVSRETFFIVLIERNLLMQTRKRR